MAERRSSTPEPCASCDDSGYVETFKGGIWTGEGVSSRLDVCACPCGDDVRREQIAAARPRYGRGTWASPGDRPGRKWLLRFDDVERADMVWDADLYGEGEAERLAWEAWERFAPSWNCYLFATAAREEVTPAPCSAVVAFLLGEAPLDGVWFGEVPPGKPTFWWRSHLRAALIATGPTPHPPLGQARGVTHDL